MLATYVHKEDKEVIQTYDQIANSIRKEYARYEPNHPIWAVNEVIEKTILNEWNLISYN